MDEVGTKKVLHVTFNMEIGGAEQVICQIIENSDAGKFAHEILCIDGKIGDLGQDLQTKGFHVVSEKRRQGLDLKLVRYIHRLILKRDISVLHCHQYTPYFYGALASLGTGARLIFTEHGRFYPDRHHFKRRLVNPLLALRTDYVTAISKATADAVAEYEYFSRDKITVIYNGIKDIGEDSHSRNELLKELGLPSEYRYIGTVSRLELIKNQIMMIEAFHDVNSLMPTTRLLIIGDGAARTSLEDLVKSLKIQDKVIFTGLIANAQRFINLFEVFLLSSFSEGASMTLLEAMSLSKPCVVTDVGGNAEIVIDNVTGIVTTTNNRSMFAQAITRLLEDENLRFTFGKEGRERLLKCFALEHMTSAYHSIYLR